MVILLPFSESVLAVLSDCPVTADDLLAALNMGELSSALPEHLDRDLTLLAEASVQAVEQVTGEVIWRRRYRAVFRASPRGAALLRVRRPLDVESVQVLVDDSAVAPAAAYEDGIIVLPQEVAASNWSEISVTYEAGREAGHPWWAQAGNRLKLLTIAYAIGEWNRRAAGGDDAGLILDRAVMYQQARIA